MNQLVDSTGQAWPVQIDFLTVERVRGEIGFDLVDAEKLFDGLSELPVLADVLFSVLRPQIESAGLTREQFYQRLDGDAFESGFSALAGAVLDFFPKEKRAIYQEIIDQVLARQAIELEGISEKIAQAVDFAFGSGSGKSQASAD